MADLMQKSAIELGRLVRDGEVTATELVDASLKRIEELNPELNAFILVDEEGARATAAGIGPGDQRPFAGVPIAIKDEAAVNGLRLTIGSDVFGDYVPDFDSSTVRRLREAGFVIVGRTNMPEMGILPVTEPRRYGPTRNPWDTERTPGGSSGGSAAAVAAGMVPVGHGADGGGSIRIPAACCGLVGLKVARGRVSRAPTMGESFLVQESVLTRTVQETAEILDVIAGYEPGDASWAPPESDTFAAAVRKDPGKLRIGMTTTPALEGDLDPPCEQAAREAAEVLESLGHDVVEVDPPWAGEDQLPVFSRVFGTNVSIGVTIGAALTGREPSPELVEPLTWELYTRTKEMDGHAYQLAKMQLETLSRQIVGLWNDMDVLLTPALAQRPVRIGEIDSCGDDPWNEFRKSGYFTPFTAIFNITGQPAISVPLFHGDDGLPLAVQLAGPPVGESLLLSLAAQLEEARPWAERRPELAAA
ncbi:MAG TPA: amidase [Thermoleophilaceae bacterium]|nr:amidase [Thermoleophilaceae bacterium]